MPKTHIEASVSRLRHSTRRSFAKIAEMILRLCIEVRIQDSGVRSQKSGEVRGYFVMFAHLLPPQRGTDPSPGSVG
jgi:hypothetical protein